MVQIPPRPLVPSLPPPFPVLLFLPLHTTPPPNSPKPPPPQQASLSPSFGSLGFGKSKASVLRLASAMADTGAREPEPVTPPPAQQQEQQAEETQAVDDRRLLRSQYLAVKGLISGTAVLPCETRTDSVILNFRSLFRQLAGFDFGDVCAAVFLCADEKDDMASVGSDKFCSIINKVESLHQHGKCDCFCWLVETRFS